MSPPPPAGSVLLLRCFFCPVVGFFFLFSCVVFLVLFIVSLVFYLFFLLLCFLILLSLICFWFCYCLLCFLLFLLQADVFLILWFKDNATKPMYRWDEFFCQPITTRRQLDREKKSFVFMMYATPFAHSCSKFEQHNHYRPPFYAVAGYHSFEVSWIIDSHFISVERSREEKRRRKLWRFKKWQNFHTCTDLISYNMTFLFLINLNKAIAHISQDHHDWRWSTFFKLEPLLA